MYGLSVFRFHHIYTCPDQEGAFLPEDEAEQWASTRSLKLQAMFRHMAQEALNCRRWIPQVVG